MECTGTVVAVTDFRSAAGFWTSELGFVHEGGDSPSFVHPQTQQRVTIVEVDQPDPAVAHAFKVRDLASAAKQLERNGFTGHWQNRAPDGTEFLMCRNDDGTFLLLYRPAS